MGWFKSIFESIFETTGSKSTRDSSIGIKSVIDYGNPKRDGSHDHRFNTGSDRTPAQKTGDASRTKK
jgi:hypothetical protein